MSENFDDLLGGRVTPSASFKGNFPVRWSGTIEDVTKNPAYDYDPSKPNNRGAQKFWPDGNAVMNVWVTLQTDVRDPSVQGDTGRRVLVLDSKNKLEAVQEAVRQSGASFAKGGRLDIEWYGNDDANAKNPQNPPKLYRARYQGPTFDSALAGPPTPAASAPQGNWGGQAPAASPAPATGGWGSPPAQPQAPAQGGWNAPAAPAPASSGGADWGAPAAAAAPAPAAPAPAPTATSSWQAQPEPQVHPDLVAALTARGIQLPPGATQQVAEQLWQMSNQG